MDMMGQVRGEFEGEVDDAGMLPKVKPREPGEGLFFMQRVMAPGDNRAQQGRDIPIFRRISLR
jgi:hypothetical protein